MRIKFAKLRGSLLARNTVWVFAGLGGTFALQAACFLLLARLLGVYEYGLFAGAFALVSTVAPYASLGTPLVYMRYVSAEPESAQAYWGNMVAATVFCSLFLTVTMAIIGHSLFGASSTATVVVLALSTYLMTQSTTNASSVFQTIENLKAMATLRILVNLFRLLAITALMFTAPRASALQCSIGFLIASTASATVGFFWVRRTIGPMRINFALLRNRFWEGMGFSFAGSTQAVYNDIDKTMLTHYGMEAANGIYSMAYRVVDFATTPVSAIESACMPRFFTLSKGGLSSVTKLAWKIVPIAALSGLLAAGMTLFASPLLVRMVGPGFSESLIAFRWLCWLPALRGVHLLAGGVLTATGRQNYRTGAQCFVALLNFALNLLWIPTHGWLGAAWSSLISDGTLMILNLLLLTRAISKSPKAIILKATTAQS